MADTLRSLADMLANLFQDGQTSGISAQDIRDLAVSTIGSYVASHSGSYTLVLADAGTTVRIDTTGGAANLTVPANASVAFPVGTVIHIRWIGGASNAVTIHTAGTPTLLSSVGTGDQALRAIYSLATLTKDATDTWYIDGDLA